MYKKTLILTLSKWMFFGGIIGIIIGSTTALLLQTNDFLGDVREQNSWLILCLPLGGLVLGYIYMNYGTSAGTELYKGNNLVIEGVHGKAKVLPFKWEEVSPKL